MNKEQCQAALDLIDRAAAMAPGARNDHLTVIKAKELLSDLIDRHFAAAEHAIPPATVTPDNK